MLPMGSGPMCRAPSHIHLLVVWGLSSLMMHGFQLRTLRCTVLARVVYPNREVTGAVGSPFQPLTSDDKVWFFGRRLKYSPVLAAQRIIGENIQSILVVKSDRESPGFAHFDISDHELSRLVLEKLRNAFVPPVCTLHVP